MLKSMKIINKHFMLRQGGETIVAEMNLGNLDSMIAVLSGTEQERQWMEQCVISQGPRPELWLPTFWNKELRGRR
jgi:type IV secretory pathway VirB4 component